MSNLLYEKKPIIHGKEVKMGEEEPCGCGISWLYITGNFDPFHHACVVHDKKWDTLPADAVERKKYLREIDWELLGDCLDMAVLNTSLYLVLRAIVYFGLARLWSKTLWVRRIFNIGKVK